LIQLVLFEVCMTSVRVLRNFMTIAKSGSLAVAAGRVGLTQAALSLQVRALEDEFGCELFDRGGRGLILNAQGRLMAAQTERLLKLYEEMRSSLAGHAGMVGEIAIGAVVSAMGTLARVVTELKYSYPRLKIRLITGKSGELANQVVAGQLDAAVIVELPGRPARLDWTPLYTEPLVVLGGAAEAGRDMTDLLETELFLRFDRGTPTGILIDQALKHEGVTVNEFLDLNSLETIIELVRQNVGVTVVPLLKNAHWPRDPLLCVTPFNGGTHSRTIGMIERNGVAPSTLMSTIRSLLYQSAS
jgi:DNA-binding transcriptional LysR family regulator